MEHKRWTPEEEAFLKEHLGKMTFSGLAERLGRSENAVIVRVRRLGLPPYLECGEYISLHQLTLALGYGRSSTKYLIEKSWTRRGCPIHNKRRGKSVVKVVYLEEFWPWAEKNRAFLDFSRMEPLALGAEPDWLKEQRKKDFHAVRIQNKTAWTPEEDSRLIYLLKQHKYGYAEFSEMFHRSAGAIQRRCQDLGLKERPVRVPCGGKAGTWTAADFQAIADRIRNGDSYMAIGKAVGRSEKAVRGKVYFTYLTEDADKVRAMLGDGPWGAGAPVPTVRQALSLSRTRTAVRKDLSVLLGLTCWRRNSLGWEPYWQKDMCMNWDDVKGCTAGCDNCDECTEFKRIPPQYCARCGATFYERSENRFCSACRAARKKQAQRKWCRSNRQTRRTIP